MVGFDYIVISGGSGAVGSFIIKEFGYHWPQVIFCVLRSPSSFDRLLKNIGPTPRDKLIPIYADLTSEDEMRAAAARIGIKCCDRCLAVHCAADVSWTKAERLVAPINVDGTRRFAELAVYISRKKPLFIHLSTAFIASEMGPRNTYEKTKLAAEQLLLESFAGSLILGIVRCSLIVGSQTDGWIARFNGVYPLLKIITLSRVPCLIADKSYKIDTIPLDFVFSQIIACIRLLSDKTPLVQLVVATGDHSTDISKFVDLTISRANVFRSYRGLTPLPPVSVISRRQYDFLMRASKSWHLEKRFRGVEQITKLMVGYVIYGEGKSRIQIATLDEAPPTPDCYMNQIIDYWLQQNEVRILANRQPRWLVSEKGGY